jgi:hypothetical protein
VARVSGTAHGRTGPQERGRPALTAELVASTVLGIPGVVRLHPGAVGEVATYLPGRRVIGVRQAGSEVEVHVVLRCPPPLPGSAEAIRSAVTALGALRVDVVIEDVVTADGDPMIGL